MRLNTWPTLLATSITLALSFTGLRVAMTRTPSPCEALGGSCIARTRVDVGQCRTDSVVASGRAFTFVTAHAHLSERFPDSHHRFLLCEEPYMCCIEDPCERILEGTCRNASVPADAGHKYHSGYCPPPAHAGHVMCHARYFGT